MLVIRLDAEHPPAADRTVPVIRSRGLRDEFGTIRVEGDGYRAVPVCTATGLSVYLVTG